jgi:hypothetical protein
VWVFEPTDTARELVKFVKAKPYLEGFGTRECG